MPTDYSKIPTADLDALSRNDLSKVSTPTLQMLSSGNSTKTKPVDSKSQNLVANIPGDAKDLAQEVYSGAKQFITHPIETTKGAVNNLIALDKYLRDNARPAMDAYANSVVENPHRLIGDYNKVMDAARDYITEKPVHAAANALTMMSPGLGSTTAGKVAGAAGKVTRPVTGPIKKAVSSATKEILGSATGAGRGAVEGALAGGKTFTKAMRGEIAGEEIVDNAKSALERVVEKRGASYRSQLDKIRVDNKVLSQAKNDIDRTLDRVVSRDGFDIQPSYDANGKMTFDFSKSPIVEQQALVRKALEDVGNWTDNSVIGLDELKKRLGTYARQASPRSPASTIISKLENSVRDGLNNYVPGYRKMTGGYSEATRLIKDIESNLMLRKDGMSGRITADQTLRRLTSAMRENFEMRRDLLEALGKESGSDVAQQVAGYSMNQVLPKGLVGKLSGGSLSYLAYLNPKFLPVIAASSPRVVGEFLVAYGKARRSVGRGAKVVGGMPISPKKISAGYVASEIADGTKE